MKVDHQTSISLGLVITLLAAAFSFGIMYWKVESLGKDVADIKSDVKAIYKMAFPDTASK